MDKLFGTFREKLGRSLMFKGTALGFEQNLALEDAIGSHACSLEASTRVTNSIHLVSTAASYGCHLKFRPNTQGVSEEIKDIVAKPNEFLSGSLTLRGAMPDQLDTLVYNALVCASPRV